MALFKKKKDKNEEEKDIEITEISIGKKERVAIEKATEEQLNDAIAEAGAILKNNKDLLKKAKKGAKTAVIFTCVGVGLVALNYMSGSDATMLAVAGFGSAGFGIAKTLSSKKKRDKLEAKDAEAKATQTAINAELEAREDAKKEIEKEELERAKAELEAKLEMEKKLRESAENLQKTTIEAVVEARLRAEVDARADDAVWAGVQSKVLPPEENETTDSKTQDKIDADEAEAEI